jgi:hypothetical protein
MDYQYKVYFNNTEKVYDNIKDISREFNITKEMIINIYSKIGSVQHPSIKKIERIPPPLYKKSNIVVSFD